MAEFVQLHLEETINELEQMERVGLFTREEIRKITKKRKALEYRLQRRTKSKEDYLKYIQNEVQILDLVRKRRERTGYMFKKSDIDYSIAKRINRLFRLAIMRFQSDVNIWMSHINFCKRMKWPESISRMYARLLQVHSNKPELWVAAAQWEMKEHKASETARQIMLRSLRFHPDSRLIYHEFFRLELMYINLIIKRRRAVGMEDAESDVEESDPVLERKLAHLVYKKATEKITDVDFHIGFLPICQEFRKFSKPLEKLIYDDLLEFHPNEEATWDYVAKRHLQKAARKMDKQLDNGEKAEDPNEVRPGILKCLQTYEDAVMKVPTDKMWTMYITTSLSIFNKCEHTLTSELILHHLFRAFHQASESHLLTETLYADWVSILELTDRRSEASEVLKAATSQFPASVRLWEIYLKSAINTGMSSKEVQLLFNSAVKSVKVEASLPLWKLAVEWLTLSHPTKVKSLLEKSVSSKRGISESLKAFYLEYTALHEGLEEARDLYDRLRTTPPMSEEFFTIMFKIENSQVKPSIDRLRKVLEDFLLHFGKTNINPWLDYIQLEMTHPDGNPASVTRLHWRALKTLQSELENKFVTAHTLISTGVIK